MGAWDYSQGMPDSYWQGVGYDGNDFGSGQTDAQGNSGQTPGGVDNWLSKMGYTPASRNGAYNTTENSFLDRAGNPVANSQFSVSNDDPEFWLAAMAATGAVGGGVMGAMNVAEGLPAAMTLGQSTGLGALQGAMSSAGGPGGTPTLGGAFKGALSGGLGSAINEFNPAGYAGVTDSNLSAGINRGITGATLAAASGSNPVSAGVMGALPGAVNYGADKMGLFDDTTNGYSPAPWMQSGGSPVQQELGTANNYSPSPWAGNNGTGLDSSAPAGGGFLDHIKSIAGSIFGNNGSGPSMPGGKSMGNWAEGLAGMYMANKQRQMANSYLNQIAGNRSAYSKQMESNLARKFAAGGRRSDVGGQAQALQSSLAELDSRNAPAVANLNNQSLQGGMGMFQNGLWLGNKQGWFGDSPANTMPSTNPTMPNYQINLPSLNNSPGMDYSLDPKRKFGGGG
jgi:hypothetical protein